MASVFEKIIQGEIPCYKIYEDDKTLAFLDIQPEEYGHTLVVPKVGAPKLYELDDVTYQAVMATVKKIAKYYDEKLGQRMMIKVVGVDVPYAHVHIMPVTERTLDERPEDRTLKLSEDELKEMQEKLKLD